MKNTIFVVDAISALVAHDLKMDEWGVDIADRRFAEGLMLPPGLAFAA